MLSEYRLRESLLVLAFRYTTGGMDSSRKIADRIIVVSILETSAGRY